MPATLTYGATTLTLEPRTPKRTELRAETARDTAAGYRRISLLWRKYVYAFDLEPLTITDYDALRDLWVTARAAGAYPTFAYPEWWPETTGGVLVAVDLGPQENPFGTTVRTTLTLTEVNPR